MNNTKNKMKKTIIAIAILSSFINISIAADNNSGGQIATSIVVPSYTSSQLNAAGCDQAVWNKMLTDYQVKAQQNVAIGNQLQVINQMQGAPSPSQVASCFDAAAAIINSATRVFNTISSILTGGGMDSSMLYDYAKKLAIGAACSQMNSYVNQTGLGTTIGTVDSSIGTVMNTGTTIGGVSTGGIGTVSQAGGYKPDTSGNIPYTNGSDLGNAVTGSTGTNTLLTNPFK